MTGIYGKDTGDKATAQRVSWWVLSNAVDSTWAGQDNTVADCSCDGIEPSKCTELVNIFFK